MKLLRILFLKVLEVYLNFKMDNVPVSPCPSATSARIMHGFKLRFLEGKVRVI